MWEAARVKQQPASEVGVAQAQLGGLAEQQQLLQQLQQQANGLRPSAGALLLNSGMLQQEHLPFLVELEARRLEQQAQRANHGQGKAEEFKDEERPPSVPVVGGHGTKDRSNAKWCPWYTEEGTWHVKLQYPSNTFSLQF